MTEEMSEGLILQGMPAGDREKYFKKQLEGYTVTAQNGQLIPVTGLEEQYAEQLTAVEGQRDIVASLKGRKHQVEEDQDLTIAAKSEFRAGLSSAIIQLALMEDKLESQAKQIERIRRRIAEIEKAGT